MQWPYRSAWKNLILAEKKRYACLGRHEAEDARAAADLEHGLPLHETPLAVAVAGEGGRVGRHARRVLQHGAVDREPGIRLQRTLQIL